MPRLRFILYFTAALCAYAAAAKAANAPREQSGEIFVPLPGGAAIRVENFKPACAFIRGAAVIFPGYRRNSRAYRDEARPLARQLCLLIYVPHFAKRQFPVADYQHGGNGLAAAAKLTAAIRQNAAGLSGAENLPLIFIGHSAGAQYLSRLAAYAPLNPAPARYILISAGTYAEASPRFAPPYGFQTLPAADLSAYLRAPISILIGAADTGNNAHLTQTPAAKAQGANRLSRAQNFWQTAQAQAAENHEDFAWNFRIIPNLGHEPRALLTSAVLAETVRRSLPAE